MKQHFSLQLCIILFLSFMNVPPAFCQKKKIIAAPEPKPFSIGVVEKIYSKQLGEERTINIYLPIGYQKNDSVALPVIYLLDGGADEDFIHVAGIVQFNNFPWVNRIPKSIVVGIANTNRKRDLTFSSTVAEDRDRYPEAGHSDNFIAFIEKELQPFVEKNYSSHSSKTLIGQSLGGLLATEILFSKPALFSKYIIISPSIWWDNGSLLKKEPALLREDFIKKTDVYIGVGKEGLAPCSIPHVMEVDANLLAEKIGTSKNKNVTIYFDYLPSEDHATVTHQAVFNAFRLLYPAPVNQN